MTSVSNPATQGHGTTRRHVLTGGMLTLGSLAFGSAPAAPDSGDGISHSAESIHQEPSFNAGRMRVYEALTMTEQFDQIIKLTGVMHSPAMAAMRKPTQISRHAGGTFTLFGGYIVGRHLELVPGELIVQAWRVGNWGRGVYSMVRFELAAQGGGTKILFDHAAFPNGQAEHLASGWRENYWEPLAKFLV
jgi:activator of HSP90 ATPase